MKACDVGCGKAVASESAVDVNGRPTPRARLCSWHAAHALRAPELQRWGFHDDEERFQQFINRMKEQGR